MDDGCEYIIVISDEHASEVIRYLNDIGVNVLIHAHKYYESWIKCMSSFSELKKVGKYLKSREDRDNVLSHIINLTGAVNRFRKALGNEI